MSERANQLRSQILGLVEEYYQEAFPEKTFVAGETPIPVSGKVFDATELQYLVDASLDFWLTAGRFAAEFEKQFAEWMGVKFCSLVNSGSSANLLAVTALTSPLLGDRRLVPGDEVITVAAGFPTTVNPIFQNQLVPVFLDIEIPTYNVDVTQLDEALSSRTRAIMLAHTLGNPFDLDAVMAFAKKHDLWVIEDNCDAVGSLYRGQKTGTFGHLSTVSFYPAHHITMGEGGAVLTNDVKLKRIVESLRDWGRDCWCPPGVDNSCGKRFEWQLGDLPFGYDHKYTYSHVGYNLKLTDMQAAVGLAQLQKLPSFIQSRQKNFLILYKLLLDHQDIIMLPKQTQFSKPSWFGFPLFLQEEFSEDREMLLHHLTSKQVGTRLIFASNLLRQPSYHKLKYRIIGSIDNSNHLLKRGLWVGLYPGIKAEQLQFLAKMISNFKKKNV